MGEELPPGRWPLVGPIFSSFADPALVFSQQFDKVLHPAFLLKEER
jgi:hypothetical protein